MEIVNKHESIKNFFEKNFFNKLIADLQKKSEDDILQKYTESRNNYICQFEDNNGDNKENKTKSKKNKTQAKDDKKQKKTKKKAKEKIFCVDCLIPCYFYKLGKLPLKFVDFNSRIYDIKYYSFLWLYYENSRLIHKATLIYRENSIAHIIKYYIHSSKLFRCATVEDYTTTYDINSEHLDKDVFVGMYLLEFLTQLRNLLSFLTEESETLLTILLKSNFFCDESYKKFDKNKSVDFVSMLKEKTQRATNKNKIISNDRLRTHYKYYKRIIQYLKKKKIYDFENDELINLLCNDFDYNSNDIIVDTIVTNKTLFKNGTISELVSMFLQELHNIHYKPQTLSTICSRGNNNQIWHKSGSIEEIDTYIFDLTDILLSTYPFNTSSIIKRRRNSCIKKIRASLNAIKF